MIRDNEIKRLVSYLNGLGVKVIFYTKGNPAAEADWSLDGTLISVYSTNKKSKTDILLDLIHEAGHTLWFIHEKNRQPDLKFEEAITRENVYQIETDTPTPKHLRKKILDIETDGTKWWDTIIKDVNIKIPQWKVNAAKEFDIWMYQMYYENGHFPKGKLKKAHSKAIYDKWRSLKNVK